MPKALNDKFYMYCLGRELETAAPEEVLFNPVGVEATDLQSIEPVLDFYTTGREFGKLMEESTKGIDMSKLAQSAPQQPAETVTAPAEPAEPVKKRFKVDVVGFDAAKKLNVIKEIKAMLGVGLKEAKEMVEKLPFAVKADLDAEETDKLKAKLESIGCTVEIK